MSEGILALKGHGFSRAITRQLWIWALQAAEKGLFWVKSGKKHTSGAKARIDSAAFVPGINPWPTARTSFSAVCATALMLAAATQCSAQQQLPSAKDATAHELAQKVDRHYNQLHSFKAGFTESYEGLGIKRTESGILLLLKPGRMKWDYSSPAGKLFLLDGKYAWFYSRGDSQVQRIPAKELDDLRSPLRFLLGHTELEKELDNLKLANGPNGLFALTGQPKGQEKRVSRLTLTVTAEGAIDGIEIEEADGALTRFTFTGEVSNAPVAPEAFHFTPPAGVPVVDALPPV
jgi:outer membrane lipoprotein carrier protein